MTRSTQFTPNSPTAARRHASLLGAALVACLLASIAPFALAQATATRMGLTGPVASVEQWGEFPGATERRKTATWTFAPDGTVTESVTYAYDFRSGALQSRRVTSYDEAGNALSAVVLGTDDAPQAQSVYRYDDAGRLEEQIDYDATGVELQRTSYRRDAAGHVVGEETIRGGEPVRRVEIDVDAEGRTLAMRRFDGDDRLTEERQYTVPGLVHDFVQYDDAGEVEATGTVTNSELGTEHWIGYDADGALSYEFTWTFDDVGRVIERREQYGDDVTVYGTTYEDDATGNWTRMTMTEDRGSGPEPYEIREREITYR